MQDIDPNNRQDRDKDGDEWPAHFLKPFRKCTAKRERERDPSSGQPTVLAEAQETKKQRAKDKNKGKTHAKHSSKACNSKANKRKTLEIEDMDWTGLDWEDGDGSQAQRCLHSTRL